MSILGTFELGKGNFYPAAVIFIVGAAELGNWIGRRYRGPSSQGADIGTLTAAALGLLALLLAFSFSIALSRFDARCKMVLEEANAIGSTANFALMLPEAAQGPVLALLRDYAAVRVRLGVSADRSDMEREIAQSLDIQGKLWRQAVAVSAAAPQSLPVDRFVASLNEMNNIHEKRLTALRYPVPVAVMAMLICVAMVAMGFTGYNSGVVGAKRRVPDLIMSLTVAVLIMLVFDLDRPTHGLIRVPAQPLIDAAQGISR
ncbi:conserved membrane hypothetical protein [Methylocella tundrae]|uniref:DUF4239 domain-containing protein n=1 Tax=Methylocella tundrae TaxID=227605 RepID=A0A8B6M9U7_METTU|nr:hypothetical protein [Methylocella tundrae]VTZ28320.1 conserved membrane hypothetical protein [Methylocella tundrae]VTZ51787.1 conserved membrane hypothetical protein [Methylocella tundrae]